MRQAPGRVIAGLQGIGTLAGSDYMYDRIEHERTRQAVGKRFDVP